MRYGANVISQIATNKLHNYNKLVIDVYTYTTGSTYFGIDIGIRGDEGSTTLLTRGYNRSSNTTNNARKTYEFNCKNYTNYSNLKMFFGTYTCASDVVDRIYIYNIYLE